MQLVKGTIIASRYQVVRLLGRGGMGAVYLAKHLHTGERVALKVLLPQGDDTAQVIERFRREMRAPARIRSEHVVRVTDADVAPELDGAPFLVMDLLDGCDLDKLLKSRGTLSGAEVVWIFSQIATTLDKAHALGVIHRDLKPENLFLHRDEAGELIVKLLDFGIARMAEPNRFSVAEANLTATGALLGTPTYMSPEQARGKSDQIGPASDIWSLGLIAFRLLAGHSFWQADSVAELIWQILFEPMPAASARAPHLPERFDAWFARSCARDLTQRWPDASEQTKALVGALGLNVDVLLGTRADSPTLLSSAVDALRSRDRAGREDISEQEPGAALPAARPKPEPSKTTFIPPAETVHAQPRSTRRRRSLLLLVSIGSIVAALAGSLRSTRVRESRPPPPQPIQAPVRVETANPTPIAVPAITSGTEAPTATLRHRAAHIAAAPIAKTRRRIVSDRPQSAVQSAPSAASVSTASGYEPDGR